MALAEGLDLGVAGSGERRRIKEQHQPLALVVAEADLAETALKGLGERGAAEVRRLLADQGGTVVEVVEALNHVHHSAPTGILSTLPAAPPLFSSPSHHLQAARNEQSTTQRCPLV